MATRREILDDIDSRFLGLVEQVAAMQEAYAQRHGGRYFQGLATHGTRPSEGGKRPADQLGRKPTDQAADWQEFGLKQLDEAFALQMHAYDGPLGRGWLCVVDADVNGDTWRRVVAHGPEGRSRRWTVAESVVLAAVDVPAVESEVRQ